ncbi:hypothetical protein SAMN05192568_102111 [Methylobacterium pseudosasicola]|uniref:Uncharacterized protein n=1 Tax=Methylobacterium pseudosasicola TaxID=582667 RepID=A0A1I4NK21_9HYPH|nr:hypothetical protein SAMN05192568_102111 [Methylobacterium pseudosasicola]
MPRPFRNAASNDEAHAALTAARVAAPTPRSTAPSVPSNSTSRPRARLTRLFIVPTATPQTSAASS